MVAFWISIYDLLYVTKVNLTIRFKRNARQSRLELITNILLLLSLQLSLNGRYHSIIFNKFN